MFPRLMAQQPPLVEREGEISAIEDLVAAVSDGTGGLLWFEGEPGLGKSRLLSEGAALGRSHGVEVLNARAREGEREYPFGLALQLFEPGLTVLEPVGSDSLFAGAASLASPLFHGRVPPDGSANQPTAFSLVHGLYWLTVNLAERRPLLLCVDDVQWSDEASARFLGYLAERLSGLPLGLIIGARPPGATDGEHALTVLQRNPAVDRRVLRALDPQGVREVIRLSFPSAEDDFCAACAAVTAGNPFHINEVLLEVSAHRLPPVASSSERLRELGAATVSRVALFRLIRLGRSARALASALAVLGDDTPLRRAAGLAGLEVGVAAEAADALAAQGILLPGQPLSFVHPLIQASIADETQPVQRGLTHLAAARLLHDENAPPEQVAAHLLQAPGVSETWTVESLRIAARQAWSRGAPESAVRYLRRALDEPPDQELLTGILTELGEAETGAGVTDASGHLREALGREADPDRRVGIARLLARALAHQGHGSEAATVLEAAIDAADDHELTPALLGDYLACSVFEPGQRQRAFARADPLLDSMATPADHVVMAALALRSAQEPRSNGATIALAERAWADGALVSQDGIEGSAWLMVVWAFILAEAYDPALRITATAIDEARRVGSVTAFSTASYFHGYACLRLGRLAEAQADAEQTTNVTDSVPRRYGAVADVLRAVTLVERDQIDLAEKTIARAGPMEQTWMLDAPWRLHARGRIAFARQRPSEALKLFLEAGTWLEERLSVQHTVLPWRIDAAHAALAIGERQTATDVLGPLQELIVRSDAGIAQAKLWGVQGLVEGGEAGIALLERSATTLGLSPARLEHAYALADLGAALRRAGRRSEARVPLRHALDLAQRLDAALLAGRLYDELAAAGARPRRDAISGADALTPSEQRIAGLAVQQLTNNQIAQSLFVTPKTVEYHLRHVYQKLGINGRGELKSALVPSHPASA
jgi:DNA-binding CsgD family transcriptional regulator